MKFTALFLTDALTAATFISSCKKEPVAEAVYTIQLNECATASKNITICFDSLVEDSRCHSDVECIWQGVANCQIFFASKFTGNSILPGQW